MTRGGAAPLPGQGGARARARCCDPALQAAPELPVRWRGFASVRGLRRAFKREEHGPFSTAEVFTGVDTVIVQGGVAPAIVSDAAGCITDDWQGGR